MKAARVIVAAVCGVLCGCAAAARPADNPPTLAQLRTATITGITREPITLTAGAYEGPPFEPGAASRLRVTLLEDHVAFGHLSGVPGRAAAALLRGDAGGSGTIVYVAVFRMDDARVVNAGTAMVGDRIEIRALRIVDGVVAIDVVESGPGDAMCCPSRLARKTYAFREGALESLTLLTLGGSNWTLVSHDDRRVPSDARAPTITFAGSRVSGFAGCNRYSGEIHETTPGAISIGALAVTKIACQSPAMELESRYLAALATVTEYTFVGSDLLLTGSDRGASPRLTFARVRPPALTR